MLPPIGTLVYIEDANINCRGDICLILRGGGGLCMSCPHAQIPVSVLSIYGNSLLGSNLILAPKSCKFWKTLDLKIVGFVTIFVHWRYPPNYNYNYSANIEKVSFPLSAFASDLSTPPHTHFLHLFNIKILLFFINHTKLPSDKLQTKKADCSLLLNRYCSQTFTRNTKYISHIHQP